MTAYREYHNGDAWITADENNERNAARGTFVRSGGTITIAASSNEPLLSIAATEFRVEEQDYSLGSDTQALPANATAYPRRDLVIARKPTGQTGGPSYDVLPGEPISPDLLQRLQNPNQPDGARIDDEGLPIHPPESIPQVQPPDARNLRDEATVLGMVFSPPGTADSTDLADEYITDLRREGIGVDGVLRTGDAASDVEQAGRALDIDIKGSSQALGGSNYRNYARSLSIQGMNLNRTDAKVDHRVAFGAGELTDNPGFAAYHIDLTSFGNYASNDDLVYISADIVAIHSDSGISYKNNIITTIGATNADVTIQDGNTVVVYFDSPNELTAQQTSGDMWPIRRMR